MIGEGAPVATVLGAGAMIDHIGPHGEKQTTCPTCTLKQSTAMTTAMKALALTTLALKALLAGSKFPCNRASSAGESMSE